MIGRIAVLVVIFAPCARTLADENLLTNGDFERGLSGWSRLWTRTPGGRVSLDTEGRYAGRQSARIEHTGSRDWSFGQEQPLDVRSFQIYELRARVQVQGEGTASICVTLRDANKQVIDWAFGERTASAGKQWRLLRSRFVIPPTAKTMWPRLIGHGPATIRLDDVTLELTGTLGQLRAADLPEALKAGNGILNVTLHPADATLSVLDRRKNRKWTQKAGRNTVVLDARAAEGGFNLRLLEPASMLEVSAAIRLETGRPELTVELSAEGELWNPLSFPHPFVSAKGMFLVLPVNEGISYPVDDQTLKPMRYYLYGGHGLCMPWWGATDGEQAMMAIVETPDDAVVGVPRVDGLLSLSPQWVAQKGKFGPSRRLRYVFFDRDGYVAMCKRYRSYAQNIGTLKTLAQKRAANPHVDLLVGAVNVWCWQKDAVAMCREMQSLGIDRILWSHRSEPDEIRALNAMGVLTSRYDIYQDVMNPAEFPKLYGVHPDWPTAAWPQDLMTGADGQWTRGWRVKGKDGLMHPCGVLCDRRAVDYARRRIPQELKTHAYRCRFIDTTTASPWRECYHADHPMTRSESRHWKMELLRVVSQENGLVTGSETGHDAAVPYVHYFEGMMSLGPYRVPDAGRQMMKPWHKAPERVAKFQTGHYYRLPLWELVYHDCVVAQWYWGDYNNKLPSLWDRRDLFNALYGTPPMFMFNAEIWRKHRDRFVESYKTAARVARATGYAEMLSHRWLTSDHAVQQTRFANGVVVTVNFGKKPHTLSDGGTLAPLTHRVEGIGAND